MFEGCVDKVEMHAFHEEVGGDESHLTVGGSDDGTIVAYALQCRGLAAFYVLGETADEPEFTQLGNLHQERSIIARMMAATRGCASLAAFWTSSWVTFITCP